jgi:hypothetical protein
MHWERHPDDVLKRATLLMATDTDQDASFLLHSCTKFLSGGEATSSSLE